MRTIIYKRVSTDDQAYRGYYLQQEEDVFKQFCKIQKYTILDVYTEDCSGKIFDRPEWNKILKFLKKIVGKLIKFYVFAGTGGHEMSTWH